MGYDIDIIICDIDYYIGFIDCEILFCVLGRMNGRNWKRGWEELEDDGKIWKWWEILGSGEVWCGVL